MLIIAGLWLLFIVRGIDWGLPNPRSFSADAAALPYPNNSGLEMMASAAHKYPPLQYLIYSVVSPAGDPTQATYEELIARASQRLIVCRLVTALMVLGTALATFLVARLWLSPVAATIAPALFLTLGISVYYGHVTNLDQPYVFWWMLSLYAYCVYAKLVFCEEADPAGGGRRLLKPAVVLCLCAFLSVATKDQAYGLYPLLILLPLCVSLAVTGDLRAGTAFLFNRSMLIALGIGVVTYIGVYLCAGGSSTFLIHYHWITGQGVSRFRQFDSGVIDRLRLVWHALVVFYQAAGPPLSIMFLAGLGAWLADADKLWHRLGLAVMLLPAASTMLFFFQATRFCYSRFWLPVLPLVCIVGAYGLAGCSRRAGRWQPVAAIGAVLIVWHALGGLEVVYLLQHDPRTLVREQLGPELRERIAAGELTVGVLGAVIGERYALREDGQAHIAFETVVNSSNSQFGIIASRQLPLVLDPLPIMAIRPDLLVGGDLTQSDRELIGSLGYRLQMMVPQPRSRFNHFADGPPGRDVYVFEHVAAADWPSVPSRLGLAQQLLVIEALGPALAGNETRLRRLGQLAAPFELPEVAGKTISADSLQRLATAYQLAGRPMEAVSALDASCELWPSAANRQYRAKFLAARRDAAAWNDDNATRKPGE